VTSYHCGITILVEESAPLQPALLAIRAAIANTPSFPGQYITEYTPNYALASPARVRTIVPGGSGGR
ncbi:MAG: hypothetical protein KGO05_13345, partial [Chloroflexota bacterium]|nr:hypothetical protein [Chloroflexota bacterium]